MPQSAEQIQLPDYDNPPVIETVVGVQFQPLVGFTNAHLGAFWQSLNAEDWPSVKDMPLLPQQEERFTPEAQWGKALRFQLSQDPTSRLQIRNIDGNRMVQIQNGRMHLNWLGEGGDRYPRYERVRAEFANCLTRLTRLVDDNQLGPLVPDQWEVTYVNHIPQNGVWQTPADWSFFKPLNVVPTIDGLIEAESFSGQWHFVIPDQRGRLHANWQHSKRSDTDESEFIRLTLTARGPINGGDHAEESILSGVDLGRETIVLTFRHLMNDLANKEWKLRDVPNS